MAQPNNLPDYFKCPISLDIMSDPVILSSGHTFDRVSIQRWLDSGHLTCPITKLPLPESSSLIPNHALRSLILNYSHHPNSNPARPDPVSSPDPMTLISTLTSTSATRDEKTESLTQLTRMVESKSNRARLTESGAVSAVLRCVDQVNASVTEKALNLILNLSLESDDVKVGLVAEGAVTKLVTALENRSSASAVAATLLTSLATVEVNKATIGSHPGAIKSLVQLLKTGGGRERKEAATALFALCSFPENRRKTVNWGGVPVLVKMAKTGLERAIEVLGLLAKCKEGREEMVRCEGIVEILVNYVKNGSLKGVQYGLMSLNMVCCCSEKLKNEVKNQGVLEICVGLIQDDNEKIHKVASSLAKVLQEN